MTTSIDIKDRIIFALDMDDPARALAFVDRLSGRVRFYKVGLELFLSGGFEVIDRIVDRGHKVMVDLKFFDIPQTVARAVARFNASGATFLTVHGNDPIVRAAVEAAGDAKILAVTVLTSFGEEDMREMGATRSVADLVLYRARRALRLGCAGVVSSGLEAAGLRAELGDNFLVVTPGIRPGANVDTARGDDQKRVATAMSAIRDGADYLVIGRPIANAPDPLAVVASLQAEISRALAER